MSQNIKHPKTAALGFALLAISIALAAFGTHSLKPVLSVQAFGWFSTATQHLTTHALALLALGILQLLIPAARLGRCVPVLLFGITIFCGTLYGLSAGGPRWLGAITPIGGAALIGSYLFVALTLARTRQSPSEPTQNQ